MIKNYDSWKLMSPDDEYVHHELGKCEDCGHRRPVSRVRGYRIGRYVCDECRFDPDEALQRKRDAELEDKS